MSIELAQLRKQLRKQRRQVSAYQQQQSELQILQRLRRAPEFKHATRVGIYLHAFGEIQTRKIIEYCFHQKKAVYLPMICSAWCGSKFHVINFKINAFHTIRWVCKSPWQHVASTFHI